MTLLNFMLMQAVDPAAAGKGSMIQMVIMLLLVGVVFYFFMIKPQQKRQKELQELRTNLKKGDAVITQGGVHGTVVKSTEKDIIIAVAENVEISVDKNCVYPVNDANEVRRAQ